jgi:hypothetical protein
MSEPSDLRNAEFIVPPITPTQADAVRRHIAAHAHDNDDRALLTAALGLETP